MRTIMGAMGRSPDRQLGLLAALVLVLLVAGAAIWRWADRQPASLPEQLQGTATLATPNLPSAPAPTFDPAQMQFQQMASQVLVGKYGIDPAFAAYLAQAKLTVVAQAARSFDLRFELPDGAVIEQQARIEPDVRYTPTAAELQQDTRRHRHTWNVKLEVVESTPERSHVRLSYFVPYGDMPDTLRQSLQPAAASAWWERLLPTADADEGGSVGASMVSDTVMEGVKEGLKQGAEHGKLSKNFPTPLSRLVDTANALKKSQEHQEWMDQLDALADCVQHPTNPLTKKAYSENPAYRDQQQQGIDDARSDVKQFTGMRYANLLTSVASDLVEGPLGVLTAPLASYSEETLKGLSESRVEEARRSVADCRDRQPQPGRFKPMRGEWKYDWRPPATHDCTDRYGVESCSNHSWHRQGQGTFTLEPAPTVVGVMGGTGSGTIQYMEDRVTDKPHIEDHQRVDGDVQVTAEGGGSGDGGVIKLTIHGDHLKMTTTGSINGVAKTPIVIDDASFDFECKVERVDMENGGTYRAFVMSDEPQGSGTCEVTVSPE
jgi:hypothetical protein